jgi:hypothetical protein
MGKKDDDGKHRAKGLSSKQKADLKAGQDRMAEIRRQAQKEADDQANMQKAVDNNKEKNGK